MAQASLENLIIVIAILSLLIALTGVTLKNRLYPDKSEIIAYNHFLHAEFLYNIKKFKSAANSYTISLKLNGKNEIALNRLGNILAFHYGKFASALPYFLRLYFLTNTKVIKHLAKRKIQLCSLGIEIYKPFKIVKELIKFIKAIGLLYENIINTGNKIAGIKNKKNKAELVQKLVLLNIRRQNLQNKINTLLKSEEALDKKIKCSLLILKSNLKLLEEIYLKAKSL